jgi:hypothetical protein
MSGTRNRVVDAERRPPRECRRKSAPGCLAPKLAAVGEVEATDERETVERARGAGSREERPGAR